MFRLLDWVWGSHTINRCATWANHQLPQYNSRFYDLGAVGIDYLAQRDWDSENNFANPPFRIIPAILHILQWYKADATLTAPHWRMVSSTGSDVSRSSDTSVESPLAQPEVAAVCLESERQARLKSKGWSSEAAALVPSALAPSTLRTYNQSLQQLLHFCQSRGQEFPPTSEHVLVDFIVSLAQGANRPKASLKIVHATLSAFYEARGQIMPVNWQDLTRLLTAVIKLCTNDVMERSNVMPVESFKQLFLSWGSNDQLSLVQLRMKAVSLLALTAMCRPSDLAPQSTHLKLYGSHEQRFLRRTHVTFHSDRMMVIFLGTKNDSSRDGFVVPV